MKKIFALGLALVSHNLQASQSINKLNQNIVCDRLDLDYSVLRGYVSEDKVRFNVKAAAWPALSGSGEVGFISQVNFELPNKLINGNELHASIENGDQPQLKQKFWSEDLTSLKVILNPASIPGQTEVIVQFVLASDPSTVHTLGNFSSGCGVDANLGRAWK